MKLDNKSNYTINFTRKALNRISQNADLEKPEEVKMFIALLKTTNGYKRNLFIACNKYAKCHTRSRRSAKKRALLQVRRHKS